MNKLGISTFIFLLCGFLCIGYYGYLCLIYGFGYIVFSWIFLLLSILLCAIAAYQTKQKRLLLSCFPKRIQPWLLGILSIGLMIFAVLEGCILYQGFHKETKQGEGALILGAQLNGSSISRLLRYRLESGLQFAKDYPNAYIIVSGGQGAEEDCSEASAMKAYLVQHGVAEDRILMEDASKNTQENLRYSKKLLDAYDIKSVSIITNDFHMFRARYLADQQGIVHHGYPARSDPDLAPNFFLREFFGSIKDIAVQTLR